MLARAARAAVAAEYQMPSLLGALAVRVNDGATSFWLRRLGARSSVSGRFAGGNVFTRPRVAALSSVGSSALACNWCSRALPSIPRRRAVAQARTPASNGNFSAGGGRSRHRSFSGRCSNPRLLGSCFGSHQVLLPNPSLVGTATGKALGPRGRRSYHRPRGPSAFPASAPQLKR